MKRKRRQRAGSLNLNTKLPGEQLPHPCKPMHAVSLMRSSQNPKPSQAATKEESPSNDNHNSAELRSGLLTPFRLRAVTLPPSYL